MPIFLLIAAAAAVPSSSLPEHFERPQVEALANAVLRELQAGYAIPAAAEKAVPGLRGKWSAPDFLGTRDPRQPARVGAGSTPPRRTPAPAG